LARMLARKGHSVRLWAFEPEVVDEIQKTSINALYLDGFELPETLEASNDLRAVLADAELLALVTPSQNLRAVLSRCAAWIPGDIPVVCCSKGIELETGKLMSDVLKETLPEHPRSLLTFLSGPSFAKEVAKEDPTAVVIAGTDDDVTTRVQQVFRTPFFMAFIHHDVRGVELGGALKNVMAIATGIVEGMGLGHNAQSALITRGLYEMIKLGRALGADPLTFAGLAGIGDLVLTCTGGLSRNRSVGIELGRGRSLKEILDEMRMVAEGVRTAQAVHALALKHDVYMPICTGVYEVLYKGKSPRELIRELTSVEVRQELGALFN
jgi:glycerol-3-phosphate dehydrogenase (NAD(P)+)